MLLTPKATAWLF